MNAEGEDLPEEGGEDFTEAHLLLESSQELASLIWPKLKPRLAVCTSNIDSSAIRSGYREDLPVLGLVGFIGIINRSFFGLDDFDDTARFFEFLGEVRKEVGLGKTDKVVLVHAGSHTTLAPTVETYGTEDFGLVDETEFNEIADWRSNRVTGGIVYEALRSIPGLEVEWLANIIKNRPGFEDIRPVKEAGGADKSLADRARRLLDREPRRSFGIVNKRLPQASLPYVFFYDEDDGKKRSFYGGLDRPNGTAYTSTDRMLADFKERSKTKTAIDPVLVKVAPFNLQEANPLDAPVLRDRHLKVAAEVGIKRVLLDKRVGIIDTTETEKWPSGLARPEIFAV